jgi:hypothetical protein
MLAIIFALTHTLCHFVFCVLIFTLLKCDKITHISNIGEIQIFKRNEMRKMLLTKLSALRKSHMVNDNFSLYLIEQVLDDMRKNFNAIWRNSRQLAAWMINGTCYTTTPRLKQIFQFTLRSFLCRKVVNSFKPFSERSLIKISSQDYFPKNFVLFVEFILMTWS